MAGPTQTRNISIEGILYAIEYMQINLNKAIDIMAKGTETPEMDKLELYVYKEYVNATDKMFLSMTPQERKQFQELEESVNRKVYSKDPLTGLESRFLTIVSEHHAIRARFKELSAQAMRRNP